MRRDRDSKHRPTILLHHSFQKPKALKSISSFKFVANWFGGKVCLFTVFACPTLSECKMFCNRNITLMSACQPRCLGASCHMQDIQLESGKSSKVETGSGTRALGQASAVRTYCVLGMCHLTWTREEGSMNRGCRLPLKLQKARKQISRAFRKNQFRQHLDYSLVTSILDFWSPDL